MEIVQLSTEQAVSHIVRALQCAPKSRLRAILGRDRLKREEAIEQLAEDVHRRMMGEGGAILRIQGRTSVISPSQAP